MPTGREIKNHFHIDKSECECTIIIHMQSKDHDLMETIMNSISFETSDLEFRASPPHPNTQSLERTIYVWRKKDI
jgi:hypothetical protein